MTLQDSSQRIADLSNPHDILSALCAAEPATLLFQELFEALNDCVGSPARTAAVFTAATRGESLPRLVSTCDLQPGDLYTGFDSRQYHFVYNGVYGAFGEERATKRMFRVARSAVAVVTVTGHIEMPPYDERLIAARDSARKALLARMEREAAARAEDDDSDGDSDHWTPEGPDDDVTRPPFRAL